MQSRLAAFKIFRRSATAAIFSGRGLEYIDIKHLSNNPKSASEGVHRFVGWILENFHPELAALATDEDDNKLRAEVLTGIVESRLREQGIPVWKVSDRELLEAYATPALTQKHELRSLSGICSSVLPAANGLSYSRTKTQRRFQTSSAQPVSSIFRKIATED